MEFMRFSPLGPDLWAVSGDGHIANLAIQPTRVTSTRTLTDIERKGISAFLILKGGDRLQ
jgi:hypothetical protein